MSTEEQAAESSALSDLIASDGWKAYRRLIERSYGAESTLRKVNEALRPIPPGQQFAVDDATQQILAGQRAVFASLELPRVRIQELQQPVQSRSRWRGRAGA